GNTDGAGGGVTGPTGPSGGVTGPTGATGASGFDDTDTGTPDVPILGVDAEQGTQNSARYQVLIGLDKPSSPANWGHLLGSQIQISTDSTFAAFPTGKSLNKPYSHIPPF